MTESGLHDAPDGAALKVCEHCDAVYRRVELARSETAYCARCGTELYHDTERQYQRLLPIVIACLIIFLICNAFPIVAMEIQGLRTQTTAWESVLVLLQEDMVLVATLVFATTIFFPFAELSMLLYVLVPLALGRVPPGFGLVIRWIRMGRPWGMIEVFMLGIVAALVKLSTMATIVPGISLWSFALLTLLLTTVLSYDPAELWDRADKLKQADER
jgi:paraquat-inducible protein A